ncbi:MAG TPA: Ig-like domain-containing protein [Thermoanaerobaculia bacterium]
MTGTTINVPAGGNLQSAIDSARLGDTIVLAAGATYTGNYTLPAKTGSGWIIIRSSAADSSLPAPGRRMTPLYASLLPKIVTPNSLPAIQTAAGAHHYRFVAVEFTTSPGVTMNYGLIYFGTNWQTASEVPSQLILDRVYVHGQPTRNMRRGVALNSAWTAVIDSYISECHEQGADAQAVAGWNGPGPFKIVNNYLEGSGENVLFGGQDPSIANLVPSDIEVRGNYVFKPLRWRVGHSTYAGIEWTVKNSFELKNSRRVLVEGNIFENNWVHGQNGFAILFTPRNQDGTAPWSVVEDVTFTNNIVKNSTQGLNMFGWDDINSSQQTRRVLVRNNLWENIDSRLFQVRNGTVDTTIDHNTCFHGDEMLVGELAPNVGFTFTNNIVPYNQYGMGGAGTWGNIGATLSTFFPSARVTGNVIEGGSSSGFPPGNYFAATWSAVGFVNLAGGDYRLSSTSPYKNAGTDGKDVGADFGALNDATAGVVDGSGGGAPPPPPADTTPPTVAIAAPAHGASVSSAVVVSANAADNVGVAGVRFFVDGTQIGAEDSIAPYEVSWNTLSAANGSHTLTATARDAAGNSATSTAVMVTVANVPPAQSPYYGTPFLLPGEFEAEDFDRGGEGLAYHDLAAGNLGGLYRTSEDVDIISPYAGGHVVNHFQSSEWLEYTVTVGQSAVYDLSVLVSSMFDGTRFHVEVDGTDVTGPVAVPNTGAWATFQWAGRGGVALTAGQHVLRLTADLEYFNVDRLRLTVSADTIAPSVSLVAPAASASVSGVVTVTANASDNVAVAGVRFYQGSVLLDAEDTTAPFSMSWDTTTTPNGVYSLTAVARDAAGNVTTSAPVSVTVSNIAVDTTPPSVAVQSPAHGATVAGIVDIVAVASDDTGVATVRFFVDGVALGSELDIAPYVIEWNTTAAANSVHVLEAEARDAAGNTSRSAAVQVMVSNVIPDRTPPNVAVTSPVNGAAVSGTIEIAAGASDDVGVAGVRFFIGGAAIGGDVTTAPYRVTFDTKTVANGYYSLTAAAWDAAGNTRTSNPTTIVVENPVLPPPAGPFGGQPFRLPGRLEAEDFDGGGEGVAYHDETRGNTSGFYRVLEDVDIINPAGYVVNDFESGEFLQYTVSVAEKSNFRIEALVSSVDGSGELHIEVDGVDVTGRLRVPRTGSWGSFQWVGRSGIRLTAGVHIIRVVSDAQYFNLDVLNFTLESSKPTKRRASGH